MSTKDQDPRAVIYASAMAMKDRTALKQEDAFEYSQWVERSEGSCKAVVSCGSSKSARAYQWEGGGWAAGEE